MAEKKEDKRSTRTKMLDEEYEKKPGVVTGLGRMLSRAGDAVGFTQEEEYKDKTKEELIKRKRAGGEIMNESMMMKEEGRGMAKANMQKRMKSGGISSSLKAHAAAPASKAHAKMKSGGSVSKRADGIAIKGKTKGRIV